MDLERELADLVEEHSAAVRGLEGAHAVAIRARERAAHVTEELALDERRADRAAVDHDEGFVCAGPRWTISVATSSLPVPPRRE